MGRTGPLQQAAIVVEIGHRRSSMGLSHRPTGTVTQGGGTPGRRLRGRGPAFSYIVPVASSSPVTGEEFVDYLAEVGRRAEVIVVDGSAPEVFAAHERAWGELCRHVPPDSRTLMGKVGNVMTGVRLAGNDYVVVADDDVRFGPEVDDLIERLGDAEVVRPQNYFDPLPWHAIWDSGRSLLNRVWGGDWPGTMAVRRSALLRAGGYAGDVMFENYEMVRTVEAAGGRHVVASDIFVRRLPPTTRHFLGQRVRQAYDEFARPARLTAFLVPVPAVCWGLAAQRWKGVVRSALAVAAVLVVAAECGRWRKGARRYFPLRCSLAAPLWAVERSVCVWAAVVARARGGVVYRGQRLPRAALSPVERRRRVTQSRGAALEGPSRDLT
jgi:hypothetical protein